MISSSSLTETFHFNKLINSRSAMLTSSLVNKPSVYLVQCLFNGEESFNDLALKMRAAKKIRCLVVSIPTALAGRMFLNLLRYTKVAIKVGVWTLEYLIKFLMKTTNEELFETGDTSMVDVEVAPWLGTMVYWGLLPLTWIMDEVVATKNWIISWDTGCLEKIFKASLSDMLKVYVIWIRGIRV